MSNSNATVNPLNIPLSPMRVTYNGIQVGGTTSDVTISIKYKMAPIKVDQFGDSEIDDVVAGLHYSVKLTLAEVKNKDNWKIAFPSMNEVVNGSTKSIVGAMNVGDHLYPKALPLLLHPLENADADLSEDYLFPLASCQNSSEVKYGPDKQTGLMCEFKIYPNLNVSPAVYFIHGDPSNGQTNASAAAPVAGTNTGNGTCTNVAVFNGITKTETITATCVGSSSAGSVFEVKGSISGALGSVNLPAASTSTANFVPTSGSPEVVTFKLTQGTTQFVIGDLFTIATTSSNFT